jgi:hypothetical protein
LKNTIESSLYLIKQCLGIFLFYVNSLTIILGMTVRFCVLKVF